MGKSRRPQPGLAEGTCQHLGEGHGSGARRCWIGCDAEKRTKEADEFLAKHQRSRLTRLRGYCHAGPATAKSMLLVEEPTGTVCSLRNPRTTGGRHHVATTPSVRQGTTVSAATARSTSVPRGSTASTS